MHLELISAGIHTPYTILLPPFIEQPVIPELDLMPLGHQFVIKPSHEGGGEGVILWRIFNGSNPARPHAISRTKISDPGNHHAAHHSRTSSLVPRVFRQW